MGNLHGEVFMVFFLLLSLWSLDRWSHGHRKGWLLLSAVAFAASVGSKLLPLMFLPFLVKRLGWTRTGLFTGMVLVMTALMYLPFHVDSMLGNQLDTLGLYFARFEFNASIYYVIRWVGFWVNGYNIIGTTAVWLPRIVLLSILMMALFSKSRKMRDLPRLMLFAWFVYYAFSTTVNPWYVAVLAVFAPFVTYRFSLVWMMLIPLSYHAFGHSEFKENTLFILLEYTPAYGCLLLELGAFRSLERKWALMRADVKLKRLAPLVSAGERLLDVGSGNGALAKRLQESGQLVRPMDIEEKSLFPEVATDVFDGRRFPVPNGSFDTCLFITVLHHTDNADQLIQEAKRVSDRIIIMEDVYENRFQKFLTWFADSLVNGEFYGHPHTNRTDEEWNRLFVQNGLKVVVAEHYRFLFFFRQVTYVLESQTGQ